MHRFSSDADYRIETAYREGDFISGVYDGLIARFILRGQQNELRDKMRIWLSTLEIDGIDHNLKDLPQ